MRRCGGTYRPATVVKVREGGAQGGVTNQGGTRRMLVEMSSTSNRPVGDLDLNLHRCFHNYNSSERARMRIKRCISEQEGALQNAESWAVNDVPTDRKWRHKTHVRGTAANRRQQVTASAHDRRHPKSSQVMAGIAAASGSSRRQRTRA